MENVEIRNGTERQCSTAPHGIQGSGVPKEDAPRLASLAFLRQCAEIGVSNWSVQISVLKCPCCLVQISVLVNALANLGIE